MTGGSAGGAAAGGAAGMPSVPSGTWMPLAVAMDNRSAYPAMTVHNGDVYLGIDVDDPAAGVFRWMAGNWVATGDTFDGWKEAQSEVAIIIPRFDSQGRLHVVNKERQPGASSHKVFLARWGQTWSTPSTVASKAREPLRGRDQSCEASVNLCACRSSKPHRPRE